MVTVAPASAVPVIVRPSSETSRLPAGCGGVVSTVTVQAAEGALILPVASVAVTVMVCVPSLSAGGVTLQLPLVTVAVPILTPLSKIVIMLPFSPLPLKVGVVSLVLPPLAMMPVCGSLSSVAEVMVGTSGAVVSTTTSNAADGALTLPAASVAVMVRLCLPSPSASVGVKVHTPFTT
ncbi:TPA: hypothetical protein GF715_24685 [Citrobacter rodentium NBRC 105723 = DSM 16636]|nr:hypothetical protein [Citrobacter rodentium NBRC 105723 = DSM 16636]HAT8020692.1 hypothetical protein [Citrobacter rodentium]HAT8030571.1 hypothetical protein [Citrobacter rodentium]HAT8035365.1 hypothetical protein [Citrobacter rodentium]HAT8040103.1 hypothetical protein [Citrobacter rodentium]